MPRGIVFDIDFSRAKPGDEDAILARAIAQADRVVLFEWLAERRERVVTPGGGDGGWTSIEQLHPPTEVLAAAAKALGPFPLPKLDQAAFEFWAFKSSAGDMPTTAAVALQLKALPVYDEWLAVLKEAGAPGVEHLPAHAAEVKGPPDMQQLMQTLRQMFQQDASLQQRVGEVLDRVHGERQDIETHKLLQHSPRSTPVPITITSTSMARPGPSARSPTNALENERQRKRSAKQRSDQPYGLRRTFRSLRSGSARPLLHQLHRQGRG